MKKYFTLLLSLHFMFYCLSQSFEIKPGEAISVSKGSSHTEVISILFWPFLIRVVGTLGI